MCIWPLVYVRAIMRIVLVVPEFIVLRKYLKVGVKQQLENQIPVLVSASIMGGVGFLVRQLSDSIIYQAISIALCVLIYFVVLLAAFPKIRKELFESQYVKKIIKKFSKQSKTVK